MPEPLPSLLELDPADPERHARALADGWVPVRTLLQLRCPLPRSEPWELDVRAFRPGTDDEVDWLRVNNRAFHWHPDQGDWTVERLHMTMAEPWFRPDGFLVHRDGAGRFLGSCWTKIHPADGDDPPLGEIFVIGVDPDAHGRGIGRALVLAGLDWLARQGLDTGMLYVEDDNAPARRLYEALGFTIDHAHIWYRRPNP